MAFYLIQDAHELGEEAIRNVRVCGIYSKISRCTVILKPFFDVALSEYSGNDILHSPFGPEVHIYLVAVFQQVALHTDIGVLVIPEGVEFPG